MQLGNGMQLGVQLSMQVSSQLTYPYQEDIVVQNRGVSLSAGMVTGHMGWGCHVLVRMVRISRGPWPA